MIKSAAIVIAVTFVSLFLTVWLGSPICRLLGISSREGGHGFFTFYCLAPVMFPVSIVLGLAIARWVDRR
ncbi:MAG: hypothetical protein KDA75_06030 [Planctomycetaceae bacterium]|nr:hypothetical protein [Planctomycetaceae bacterium]